MYQPAKAIDHTMIKLIARAHRWQQQLLLQGVYASIEELAQAEAISPSYVSRVMRLACLAHSNHWGDPGGQAGALQTGPKRRCRQGTQRATYS